MPVLIEDEALVLFQGDSITDAGRSRTEDLQHGGGYAMMSAALFSAMHPGKKVRFLNRGISGNEIHNLQDRWVEDCIDLKPDWVSILIGINDTARSLDMPEKIAVYEAGYRDILTRTRDELGAKLILCEPFFLPLRDNPDMWRSGLNARIKIVHQLAEEFDAIFVPFDELFTQAAKLREPGFWIPEGVHPSHAGHAMMARAWLQAVGAM